MSDLGPIALVLGVLGLFVGFCSLWLASFALRKIDSQINQFMQGPFLRLREGLTEVKERLTVTQSDLDGFKKQSKDAFGNLQRDLELQRTNVAQIHRNLVDLTEKVQQLANGIAALQPRHPLHTRQPEAPLPAKQAG